MANHEKSTQNQTQSSVYAQAEKAELLDVIEQKEKRIKVLEEYLRLARVKRFTPSSEQWDGQACLFDEAELAADVEGNETLKIETPPKPKKKTGRNTHTATAF